MTHACGNILATMRSQVGKTRLNLICRHAYSTDLATFFHKHMRDIECRIFSQTDLCCFLKIAGVLLELSQFYKTAGPRARLSPDVQVNEDRLVLNDFTHVQGAAYTLACSLCDLT